jgi:hypothetical protein
MHDEINRLGFEAWADNKIVNFIEDYGAVLCVPGEGHIAKEGKDLTISATWKGEQLTIALRAYVDGWKQHEWSVRKWKGADRGAL